MSSKSNKPVNLNDRVRYFHGLHVLVSGTRHIENEKKKQDIDTEKFRYHWNNMIWLELQAWQNARSALEHDKWLVDTRKSLVPTVIELVKNFYFDYHSTEVSDGADEFLTIEPLENPKEPKDFLNNCLSILSSDYFEKYLNAFKQVDDIMEQLSYVENLFSSSANIAVDFPAFESLVFQEKVELLSIWYNTSYELLHSFAAIMEMLDFKEYKKLVYTISNEDWESVSEIPEAHIANNPCNEKPSASEVFADAITKTTESYLRKHKVQGILCILLSKHLGCLMRAHQVLTSYSDTSTKEKRSASVNDMSELLAVLEKSLPGAINHINCGQLTQKGTLYGLPGVQPLYDFVQDFVFTIMCECLTLRLDQAQECRKQCGSTTSLLTVQQVVAECKEVIQCSFLTLDVHYALHPSSCWCGNDGSHCLLIVRFKARLIQMLHTYLDFVKLWIVALLTGLPHAPRNFIDTLHSEWLFAKEASANIDAASCIPCSCKFIDICKQIFLTTKDFLETASAAIFLSETNETDSTDDSCGEDDVCLQTSSFFWQPVPRFDRATTQQAGVLWFHRQRSESPHFARHHSVSYNRTEHPILHFSKSAPALLTRDVESHRRYLFELCRAVRDLFEEVRERSIRAITFAKTLRKDMESAIEFNFLDDNNHTTKKNTSKNLCRYCSLLSKMEKCGYVKAEIEWRNDKVTSQGFHPRHFSLFYAPDIFSSAQNNATHLQDDEVKLKILQRLVSCCTCLFCGVIAEDTSGNMFIIVRKPHNYVLNNICDPGTARKNSQRVRNQHRCASWAGPVLHFYQSELRDYSIDVNRVLAENLVLQRDVTAICMNGHDVGRRRKELRKLFGDSIQVVMAQCSVVRDVRQSIVQLHNSTLSFTKVLVHQIVTMGLHLQKQVEQLKQQQLEDGEQLFMEINRVVQKNFNTGFEYLTDAVKILSGPERRQLEESQLSYVKRWMEYVSEWIPRGKGYRPRWSFMGLNFLTSLNLDLIKMMKTDEYESLKHLINHFFDHLVGSKPKSNETLHLPDDEVEAPVYRSLSSGSSRDDSHGICLQNHVSRNDYSSFKASDPEAEKDVIDEIPRMEEVQQSIEELELAIDQKKFDNGIIGRVLDTPSNSPLVQLSIRSVSFQWQRGNKIGEGTFGRVYTCVNMNTGKILAMKEISFQAHDEQHIKQALDEITNFEGISHPNLVKYYGVELHCDQMIIFMDFCDAGTLEEVSRIGLPGVMIQQYTAQLATAVSVLHHKGFVHRDIKGSNIFLTSSGLLKLGDFGSAVRLMNRSKTLDGEIASHRGVTAAYSAPEVINSNESRGYGRASDIWSIGCVVIEMSTGKRPWHDHEPFQILYKVGTGSKPPVPSSLSQDGRHFVERCLQVDPTLRWNIDALQGHPFVKVAQPGA